MQPIFFPYVGFQLISAVASRMVIYDNIGHQKDGLTATELRDGVKC